MFRARARIVLTLLAIGLGSILSGCSRPDLVGSPETTAKYDLLKQDPMYPAAAANLLP
jgi:hypothetical protein